MEKLAGLCVFFALGAAEAQEWPTVRGNAERTGAVDGSLPSGRPLRIWVRHFAGERLGSAMEPIVAEGLVFIATHFGNVYALRADSGEPVWRFQARGPFLHSPAYQDGKVLAASTDGNLYALEARTGKPAWTCAAPGGFAASPAAYGGNVLIGSRSGTFLSVDAASGRLRWKVDLSAPVRQTAALSEGRVFVTARVRHAG